MSLARFALLPLVLLAVSASPLLADVHTVQISEYYTTCDDGSSDAQYIELRPYTAGQFFRQCASLQIKRTVAGPDLYFAKPVFVGHTDGESFPTNKTFLVASPALSAVTGITPDLVIPDGILDPAGGVIRFAADSGCAFNFGTIHEIRYGDQGAAPAPGADQAANLSGFGGTFSLGTPTPRNFAGETAASWTCDTVPVETATWTRIKSLYP